MRLYAYLHDSMLSDDNNSHKKKKRKPENKKKNRLPAKQFGNSQHRFDGSRETGKREEKKRGSEEIKPFRCLL